jgi:riboflavin synthase
MFTGLVRGVGRVESLEPADGAVRLALEAIAVRDAAQPGASIAVDGVCLTVAEPTATGFVADVMPETLRNTTLGEHLPGRRVNLEPALRADDRLGGHIVQGHVDGVGTILGRTPSEHWEVVEVSMPVELGRYLVDKGSITVDGVSLTVVEATDDRFTVSLIPETLARTTLGSRQPGDRVNLEVDVLAKHVEKLLSSSHVPGKESS